MNYKTPDEHRLELHFPRSRFSRDLEDKLLILASKIAEIGTAPKDEFAEKVDILLRSIGDADATPKTIANQRTEMISLFGLAEYRDGDVICGSRTLSLIKNQDVPRFFKSLCKKFQYPGGFVKPNFTKEYVKAGVKFKPARYITMMLRSGKEATGNAVALSPREVAHLVFNDKRVTVGGEAPSTRMRMILEFRQKGVTCDATSDVIRYARDFLNYMVQANLLAEFKGSYFLNEREKEAIDSIEKDGTFFDEYTKSLKPDGEIDNEVFKQAEADWQSWFTNIDEEEESVLNTPIESFAKETLQIETDDNQTHSVTVGYELPPEIQRLKEALEAKRESGVPGGSLKDIGDEGEAIVYEMEKKRVSNERPDMLALVRIVSNDVSLGFDIQSVLMSGTKKYIEVKTTKRNYTPQNFLATSYFDISSNEWLTARQHNDSYYIYRVIIAKEEYSIFVIQNPVKRHEEGKLRIEPLKYRVVYSPESGAFIIEKQNYNASASPSPVRNEQHAS